MKDILKDFLQHLRRRDVSRHTLTAYENDVATFLKHTSQIRQKPFDELTPADVDAFAIRAFLGELHKQRISASSSARKLSAIRTFVKFLRRDDLIEDDPSSLVAAPKKPETIPAHLTIDEMNRLLEMPDTSQPLGRRDRAILELFYASGLRLSELVGLDIEDVNLSGRMVRVLGKGRKERLVPFNTSTADALRAWMKDRGARQCDGCDRCNGREGVRSRACERGAKAPLFLNYRGGRLSTRSVDGSCGVTSRCAAQSSASARTRCGTHSPPICSRMAPTCARFRSCWAMPGSARPSATPTSTRSS